MTEAVDRLTSVGRSTFEIKPMKDLLTATICALIAWSGPVSAEAAPLTSTHVITMNEAKAQILQKPATVNISSRQVSNFWKKVNKDGPTHPYDPSLGQCWEWIGGRCSGGYGTFWCGGKVRAAHRVSLILDGQELIVGLDTMHSCDRPYCVNPSHLRQGTTGDNIHDALSKGRHVAPYGEGHGRSVLTESKVLEIRKLSQSGMTKVSIAKKFGIGRATLYSMLKGDTWKHIA